MNDKPALVVFAIALSICCMALLCLSYFIFFSPRSAVSPLPTSSPVPTLPPTASNPLPNADPTVSISVSPNKLMEGVEVIIHIEVNNPGKMDLQGYILNIGYGAKNDTSTYLIQDIPFTSDVVEFFKQDISWNVDYIPGDHNYEVRVSILSPDFTVLTETSAPIEFVKPSLSISISPTQLTSSSEAVIHIQVDNPSGAEMQDYTLLIGYTAKDDESMFSIRDIPFSLAPGETFEQDVSWNERLVPSSGEFELRMVLLRPDGTVLTEAKTLFTLDNR